MHHSHVQLNTRVDFHFENFTQSVRLLDVNRWFQYALRICVNYASQVGASFILLVVLLLITRPEKRSSPIFILNAFGLAFNILRNLLQIFYYTGALYNAYAYFSFDFSLVSPTQYNLSIASVVFALFVTICVEASLVLQVKAITATMRDLHKVAVLVFSIAVALVAIGFRFALTIKNSIAISAAKPFTEQWLAATSQYVITGTICFFSFVFIAKLGVAIFERRRLGIKQFGPMQIIFIMGCQTMIVPALFSILENFTSVPELGTQVLTMAVIFMPLSSLWASTASNGSPTATPASRNPLLPKTTSDYSTTTTSNSEKKT